MEARLQDIWVFVDNESYKNATVFKIDSFNRHSILLDFVQLLKDLDLNINKAYVSSEDGWFMHVFHVTDAHGNKVTKKETISFIKQSTCFNHEYPQRVWVHSAAAHTIIELIGTDRQGLMSEICALLADMQCNIVSAELWTQFKRVACVLYITDEISLGAIKDLKKLNKIKESLYNVLKGDQTSKSASTDFAQSLTHTERRLHQTLYADRAYERVEECWDLNGKITIESCDWKGYSVVNVQSRKRSELLFNTLCTLTDMKYVVFHAIIDLNGRTAYQEYYIRHIDGCTLKLAAERRRLIQCLQAAISRCVTPGLRLELCTNDRVGLLSDVTRIFRKHGLSVTRANFNTKERKATCVFYITDMAGNMVDSKVVEAIRQEICRAVLQVSYMPPAQCLSLTREASTPSRFSFGSLLGTSSQVLLYTLGSIKLQ